MATKVHLSLRRAFSPVLSLLVLTGMPTALRAQTPSPDPQATYRLSTSSRIVLTDVTVTDAHGQRVSGLTASDFVLTDEGKPQNLSSFTEHTPEDAPPLTDRSPTNPAAFTNTLFVHPPPVLNVILIDITNLEVVEQLYLNYQLTRLINTLPAGQPVALYWCRQSNAILLQGFTSDHEKLTVALHKALPRFPPTGREYLSTANTLHQLAVSLAQLPGRKNVLWFSGGTPNLLSPFEGITSLTSEEDSALHLVYDELESSRITVYPFDARGLVTDTSAGLLVQQQLMREVAENTGGRAFVNTNGLQLEASHLIASDGAYYTLTYSPIGFTPDGKWHNVRIALANPDHHFELSYRRGYYADDPAHPKPSRGLTTPKATSSAPGIAKSATPDQRSAPIIFQLQPIAVAGSGGSFTPARLSLALDPAKQKHGTVLYALRYTLPLDAFTLQPANGQMAARVGVAALGFNQYGSLATRRAEEVTLDFDPSKLPFTARDVITVDQQIALPRGDTTLFCAVWDRTTGRLGTLQIPLTVEKSSRSPAPQAP